MSIGSTIRGHREALGLSGRDLAEKAHVDPNYLWRVEVSRSMPSAAVLRRIAAALGCSVAELFGEEAPRVLTEQQKIAIGLLERIPSRALPDVIAELARRAAEAADPLAAMNPDLAAVAG